MTLALLLMPCNLAAQDWRAQAQQSLDALGSVTDLIDQQNMEATVTPFETDAPPEAEIAPHQIEDEVFSARVSDSVEARGLGAQVDSALTRPDVDLGDNPLSLADAAVEAADAVASGLFVAGGEACDASLTVTPRDEQLYCASVTERNMQTCLETRTIAVDRADEWRCVAAERDYRRSCEQDVLWSCTGITGLPCLHQQVTSSVPLEWSVGRFSIWRPAKNHSSCAIVSDIFTVTVPDTVDVQSFVLRSLTFRGIAQIKINGQNVWTYNTSALGDLSLSHEWWWWSNALVYSGSWRYLGQCGDALRQASPEIDLLAIAEVPAPGHSQIVNHQVQTGPTQSRTWTIEVARANTRDEDLRVAFALNGQCCSEFTADTGGSC